MRVTFNFLKAQATALNVATNNSTQYGKAGHYYIGAAYGGYQLCQICESGGHRNITSGYATAREVSGKLEGILTGVAL